MDAKPNAELKPLTRRLLTTTSLSPDEIATLESLPIRLKSLARNEDVVREGQSPTHCCALLKGWAFRYRIIPDGGRQILSFHVPGEIPDLQSIHVGVMDHTFAAMTPCDVALIPHEAIHAMTAAHPHITAALWRDTLIDSGIFREWMVGIGRRLAYGRLAHLFCEMYRRLEVIDVAADNLFEWPLTQIDLADATGMTSVHVHRTLRQLREDRLVSIQGGRARILDWARLVEAASFDPTYLHLRADE